MGSRLVGSIAVESYLQILDGTYSQMQLQTTVFRTEISTVRLLA